MKIKTKIRLDRSTPSEVAAVFRAGRVDAGEFDWPVERAYESG